MKLDERTKKKRKIFKRFLKELGIYNAWVTARKTYLRIHNNYTDVCLWDPVDDYDYIDSIIEDSFNWAESGHLEMWRNLYDWLEEEEIPLLSYFEKYNEMAVENIERKFYNFMIGLENETPF